jgi:type II secretory pathway component PulJ
MKTTRTAASQSERQAGFTLIEIVGAFFMMTVVLVFITGIFVENGRQRRAATELMRERLSATGALALVASDLESAVLVAPSESVDPSRHPWQFIAADIGNDGARSIRFVTQNGSDANVGENATSWVEMAYFVEEEESGQLTLWRWQSARPPSEPARGFPDSGEQQSSRVAVGVVDFGIRFLNVDGSWVDDWDSTYLPPDQMLPLAAEITITLFRKMRQGEQPETGRDDAILIPGLTHTKRFALVMKPIDINALIELSSAAEDNDPNCFTINQCLNEGDSDWYSVEIEDQCRGDDALCDLLASPKSVCWHTIEASYPELAARAPVGCDS